MNTLWKVDLQVLCQKPWEQYQCHENCKSIGNNIMIEILIEIELSTVGKIFEDFETIFAKM